MLLKRNEVERIALIVTENPQRNCVKRGFGVKSRLPICKYSQCFASKKTNSYTIRL